MISKMERSSGKKKIQNPMNNYATHQQAKSCFLQKKLSVSLTTKIKNQFEQITPFYYKENSFFRRIHNTNIGIMSPYIFFKQKHKMKYINHSSNSPRTPDSLYLLSYSIPSESLKDNLKYNLSLFMDQSPQSLYHSIQPYRPNFHLKSLHRHNNKSCLLRADACIYRLNEKVNVKTIVYSKWECFHMC